MCLSLSLAFVLAAEAILALQWFFQHETRRFPSLSGQVQLNHHVGSLPKARQKTRGPKYRRCLAHGCPQANNRIFSVLPLRSPMSQLCLLTKEVRSTSRSMVPNVSICVSECLPCCSHTGCGSIASWRRSVMDQWKSLPLRLLNSVSILKTSCFSVLASVKKSLSIK